MTIKEMVEQLNYLLSYGVDADTLVVVRSEEFDPDPDADCLYYDAEADRVCIGID